MLSTGIAARLRSGRPRASSHAIRLQTSPGYDRSAAGGRRQIIAGPIRSFSCQRPHSATRLQPFAGQVSAANVQIPLRELLRLAVSLSDNTAADILLRLIGGPRVVTNYIERLGIVGFHLEDGEHELHPDVNAQYRNWFEPAGAVQMLRHLSNDSPLAPEHTRLLLDWMQHSTRGANRLGGQLPPGTILPHKPGTSDVDHGIAHATNDIGLITLPDGRHLAIAGFITDSTADAITRDAVIARAAYNSCLGRTMNKN